MVVFCVVITGLTRSNDISWQVLIKKKKKECKVNKICSVPLIHWFCSKFDVKTLIKIYKVSSV